MLCFFSPQVCTCGKHRCLPPPRRTPRYDPADIQSNYQRNYPSYPGHQPPKAFRSDDKFVSAGKFEGQSQSHRDYQAWPVETNTTSYVPPFDRSTHKTPIPFVGSTTNRDEYNWKSPSTDRAKPRDYSSIKVGVNLDGSRSQFSASTTNRDEYQKHDLSLLRSSLLSSPSKSAHRYDVRPKLPFHGSSTQRTAYPPHPIDQNVGRRVPRDQRFQPTNARFEGETTNASTYKEWDLSGRDRISLSFPAATVSNTLKPLPFHGSSTSHDAYQHTPAACPASQMLANPQHQCSHTTNEPDDRTFQTTSADNYRPLEVCKCVVLLACGLIHSTLSEYLLFFQWYGKI